MVKGYIVETMPFKDIKDYKRYLVVNYGYKDGGIVTYDLVPTTNKSEHVRKMTKTFEIVVHDTEDVMD
ncbi:hypothetical protein LCGC14_0788550 [marine sediment metagenome]|uniref:Uncharacterized protein n=1 Tax=marine sediment metagenome TaxID=412755 RepID=A0A0F9PXF8_9ZZZZ